jgi:hypothetical protein
MTRVHYVDEIFTECLYRSACNTRAKLTDANTAQRDEDVTCPRCLSALGYEPTADEQLTVCVGDPLRRAA